MSFITFKAKLGSSNIIELTKFLSMTIISEFSKAIQEERLISPLKKEEAANIPLVLKIKIVFSLPYFDAENIFVAPDSKK